MRASIITDYNEFDEIINKAEFCHLGMVDGDKPYVLPFNFGYKDRIIYLHSATTGKKNDIIAKNNNVCLSFDIEQELFFRNEEVACSYGMKYRSVIVTGKIRMIEGFNEKIAGMNIIMKKYTNKEFNYNAPSINHVNVYTIDISDIRGKKYK